MPHYVVIWKIDVEADNPLDAAREARCLQQPGTDALVFDVCDEKERLIEYVDLSEHEENADGEG